MQIIKSNIGHFNGKYSETMKQVFSTFKQDVAEHQVHAACVLVSNELGRYFKESSSIIKVSGKIDKMSISAAMKEKNVSSPALELVLFCCDNERLNKKWGVTMPCPERLVNWINDLEVELVDDSIVSTKAA